VVRRVVHAQVCRDLSQEVSTGGEESTQQPTDPQFLQAWLPGLNCDQRLLPYSCPVLFLKSIDFEQKKRHRQGLVESVSCGQGRNPRWKSKLLSQIIG
jgi:hypothetical protein